MPYSSNNASNQQTGTLGLNAEIEAALTERIVEQAITTGFTTVILLNDHGGSVRPMTDVAAKLEAKYRALMPQSNLPARRLDEILAMIRNFENVDDVSQLTRLLVPGR